MRVKQLCHKLLSKTNIHKKRLAVISEIVETIVIAKTLSVTSIGRKIKNTNQTRSNIRKTDRLYSNKHLYSERTTIYSAICQSLINSESPFIIVDGSKLPNSPWYILRASLVNKGRAITLYEHQYGSKEQCDRKLYKTFLDGLEDVLGDNIKPILITDAEFRGPWFELVRNRGWNFVGRIRGNANVALGDVDEPDDWHDLWENASEKPKKLGSGYFNKQDEIAGYFYLYKSGPKGRHAHTRTGRKSKTIKSNRHKASAIEPWLIISSLDESAHYIIRAYQFRMSIEENFRDMKSGRYGFGLRMTFSKKKSRYAIMLLVAALASMIAYLIGTAGERKGLHRQFQANSTTKRRVLSRFFLGCELAYKDVTFRAAEWGETIEYLQQEIFACFTA